MKNLILFIVLFLTLSCKSFKKKEQKDLTVDHISAIETRKENFQFENLLNLRDLSVEYEITRQEPIYIKRDNKEDSIILKPVVYRSVHKDKVESHISYTDTSKVKTIEKSSSSIIDRSTNDREIKGFNFIGTIFRYIWLIVIFLGFLIYRYFKR